MSKAEKEIAEYLADNGHTFSKELYDRNHHFFNTEVENYFAVASAISLCWTGHAKYDDDDFINYASKFIAGAIPKDKSIPANYYKRFGEESLDNALTNFRAYFRRIKHLMPDFNNCSIHDINRLQNRLLSQLNEYRNKGEITGIGPWLFLGSFKIILEDQKRLWDNEGLNTIVLPTGLEVNRGIVRLKNEGFKFMKDFDLQWLEETTGSLLDSYATCNMVHSHVVKIAEIGNTTAIHINSALYKYGRNDI